MAAALAEFIGESGLPFEDAQAQAAALYLFAELREGEPTFGFSHYARDLLEALDAQLRTARLAGGVERSLRQSPAPAAQWAQLARWRRWTACSASIRVSPAAAWRCRSTISWSASAAIASGSCPASSATRRCASASPRASAKRCGCPSSAPGH